MENEQVIRPNPTKVATKWALINTLASIVCVYAFEFLNVEATSPIQYISYLPFIAFLLLAQIEFKNELGGFITFGQAFSTGFRYALFTGLLTAVFIYIYYSMLSPERYEQILAISEKALEERDMSSAEREKAMEMTRNWGPLFSAFGAAVGSAIFGAVISLITAAIVKKERSLNDIIESASEQ